MHAFAVGQRREMAGNAVARRGISIALACRTFGVRETCYRYGPKLRAENDEIADLLVGLTDARKTWGGLQQRPPEHPFHGLQANHCRATAHRRHHTRPETENGRISSTSAPR